MARKSRRSRSSRKSSSLFAWPKVLLIIVPLFAAVFIMFNSQNGRSVLGESDSREGSNKGFFNFNLKSTEPSKGPKPSGTPGKGSCNRVTSFSAVTICESTSEKTNNAFQSYNYTCEDGTSGSVEQKEVEGRCIPIEKAYQAARKACNKKCLPTKSPTPTPEIQSQ